jgi:hypothetical protein
LGSTAITAGVSTTISVAVSASIPVSTTVAIAISSAVAVAGAVPGAGPYEDAAAKPGGAVVAVWRAGVGVITVVAVRADWRTVCVARTVVAWADAYAY